MKKGRKTEEGGIKKGRKEGKGLEWRKAEGSERQNSDRLK